MYKEIMNQLQTASEPSFPHSWAGRVQFRLIQAIPENLASFYLIPSILSNVCSVAFREALKVSLS